MRPPQVEASRQLPAPAAVGMPRAGEEWAQAWGGAQLGCQGQGFQTSTFVSSSVLIFPI